MERKSTPPTPIAGTKVWEPMRLQPVGSVGELMKTLIVGSRLDNGNAACASSNRTIGGTRPRC